jgi:hypothetical protein
MATGDITNLVVNADGTSGSFLVADLVAGIPTAFEAGKSAVLNVQSDGYTGTTLTTSTGWSGELEIDFSDANFVSSGTTYANDTFTEGTGTPDISTHIPETDLGGTGWTGSSGTYVVDSASGAAKNTVTTGTTWSYRFIGGAADGRLICNMGGSTNGRIGLCFRASDDNNLIRFQTRLGDTATGSQLIKRIAGVETTIATITGVGSVPAVNGAFKTEIVLDGNDISVYIDGVLILSATESALNTNTKVGISSRVTSNFWYDFTFKENTGYVLVDWTTQHWVASGDTVTLTADAGLLTDGVDSSNAAVALAGTNGNTTIAGTIALCNHAFIVDGTGVLLPDRTTVSGSGYTVDALAIHGYGISAVVVEVTDGSTTQTKTTSFALSNHSDDLYGAFLATYGYTYNGTGVYQSQAIDFSDFADGWITITVRAYPSRGGSSKVTVDTFKVLNNDGGFYTDVTQHVNSGGTLTLSGGLTASVIDNQLITGNSSGAIAVTNGAHSSGATSIAAYYITGTFTAAETVTVTDYKQETVATGVFSSSSWTGSDTNPGTSAGSPLRTFTKAIQNIDAVSNAIGRVKLAAGKHALRSLSGVTIEGQVIIEPDSGVSAEDIRMVNDGSANIGIPFARYDVPVETSNYWGTGWDGVTVLRGSAPESSLCLYYGSRLTHARGKAGTRAVAVKPINGTSLTSEPSFIGVENTDIYTDSFAAQGAKVRARDSTCIEVANNAVFEPKTLCCVVSNKVDLSPTKFRSTVNTITNAVPVVGNIVYDTVTHAWCVITYVYQISGVPDALAGQYQFEFDPGAGGGAATSPTDYVGDSTVEFYDSSNFAAGAPTGSPIGTFKFTIQHPDSIQFNGLTPNESINALVFNYLSFEVDGQQWYAARGASDVAIVNSLAVRTFGADASTSSIAGTEYTTYGLSRNSLVWNFTLANQRFNVRGSGIYSDRFGHQIRNCIADQYVGYTGGFGCLTSDIVARRSGSTTESNAEVVADIFEDGVGSTSDWSEANHDYRPNTSMPTTSTVLWPYDMLGNPLAGDGSDYVGAIQETAGAATTPTVTTGTITAIAATTATAAGNATADGGAAITAKGICYKTSTGPTTSDTVVSGGTGTGAFTANLTSLTSNTTYYVKAFATNSQGTVYGSEVTFKTAPVISSATIGTSGDTLTIAANAAVAGHVGFSLADISPPVSLTYSSGDPGTSQVYGLSRTVLSGEAPTLAYTPGDIVSVSGSVPLVAITGGTVTNNSTQVPATSTLILVEHPTEEIRVGNPCVFYLFTKDATFEGIWPDADPSPEYIRIYRNGSTVNAGSVTVDRLPDVTGGFEITYTRVAEAGGDTIRIMVPYAISAQAFEELFKVRIVQDDPFVLDASGTYSLTSWAAYLREHSDSTAQNNLLIGALSDDLAYNTEVSEHAKELSQDATEQIALEGLKTTPTALRAAFGLAAANLDTKLDAANLATYDPPTKAEMDAAISTAQSTILAATLDMTDIRTAVGLDYANLTTMLDTITVSAAAAALDASKTPRKATAIAAGAAVTETWTVVTDTSGTLVITKVVS